MDKTELKKEDETSENNALSVAETQHLEEEFANYKALYPKLEKSAYISSHAKIITAKTR